MLSPERHSIIGPSSWDRWVRCPGSVPLSKGLPDPADPEATEGSVFHHLVALCAETGMDAASFVGHGRGVEIDGEFHEWNYQMARCAQPGLDFINVYQQLPEWNVLIEKQMDIGHWVGANHLNDNEHVGTSDVVMWSESERRIKIMDWKYGHYIIPAQDNYQLMGYCLAAWLDESICLKKVFEGVPLDSLIVDLIIDQPRVPSGGGIYTTNMRRVLEFGERVKRQADHVWKIFDYDWEQLFAEKSAHFSGGVRQCRNCRARESCSLYHNVMSADLGFLDNTESRPPPALTPEDRSRILKMKPTINRWLRELHASALRDAQAGRPVPGLKLVQGRRGKRKWKLTVEHKVEAVMVAEFGDRAYSKPELLSPTQAEERFGPQQYSRHLSHYVDMGEPRLELVDESDRRPAVQTVAEMFSNTSTPKQITNGDF